jgi:hypothetical protein
MRGGRPACAAAHDGAVNVLTRTSATASLLESDRTASQPPDCWKKPVFTVVSIASVLAMKEDGGWFGQNDVAKRFDLANSFS